MASSPAGGDTGASGTGGSWLSLLRALLAQEEVLFGVLIAGSAAQAWWQLFGVSRSLKALQSAREITIAELNGVPARRGRKPLAGGGEAEVAPRKVTGNGKGKGAGGIAESATTAGGASVGETTGGSWWRWRRREPALHGAGGGKSDPGGGSADRAAMSSQGRMDGSSSGKGGGVLPRVWGWFGGKGSPSTAEGSTSHSSSGGASDSGGGGGIGSSSGGGSSRGGLAWLLNSRSKTAMQQQQQKDGPSDASELADYTNPLELVLVRGSVQLASPPSPSSSSSVSPSPLLPLHGAKQPCAVVERSDMMLYSELHPLLGWVIKGDQVNLVRQSVPFALAETPLPSSPRVDISLLGASQALPLDIVYTNMQKADLSWGSTAVHMLIGKRLPVGLRTEERVLQTNRELTAVGHVRRGSDGRPAIFASPRFPFFLFHETKAGMIAKLNHQWGALLGWGVLLSAAAAGIIGLAVWRTRRRRQARQQQRRQLEQAELERWMRLLAGRQLPGARGEQAAAAVRNALAGPEFAGTLEGREDAGSGVVLNSATGPVPAEVAPSRLERLIRSGDADDEEVVGEEVQSGELCVVCLHRKRKAIFIPCGHRVCCLSCARVVREEHSLCPICRGAVLAAFRVYDA